VCSVCIITHVLFAHRFVNEQHGFIKSRSTNTNLISHHNELVNAVDSGVQVDAVYMDFAKAFDRVNHAVLLRKLFVL
jgi:ribonucleases P/MRP protein subunit RPP40